MTLYKQAISRGIVAGLLATVAWGHASAGQIGIGGFSGSETVTTFTGLGLPFNNSTPLVFDGNTYTTDDGTIRYANFGFAGCVLECIGNNSDDGFIDVVLGPAVTRVGAGVGIAGSGTGFAEFFDTLNVLIGTVSVTGFAFAGWENIGGIGRFRYTDTAANGLIAVMDDFRFENVNGQQVSEPLSLALVGLGLVGIGLQRRRQAKAA